MIVASNLQGARSPRPFWRRFPAVHLFPYQCSPMSTARGVLEQFRMACRYQARAAGVRAVLVLDEVGLAEHSPDMPLKVGRRAARARATPVGGGARRPRG